MIELTHVSKRFKKKVVIDRFYLKVDQGDIIALLGPNGAGKSTLIALMLGLLKPTEGKISIDGLPPGHWKLRQRIGTVRNVNVVQAISNILYLGLALAGGLWTPLSSLPKLVRVVGEWLSSYRYGHGAWQWSAGRSPTWIDLIVLLSYFLLFVILSTYSLVKQEEV
ncbi:ATP-binding cassette domain-containing protein [Camelliibacillus cellulosilyticus]|uniref:ATP-binding cassette domain-containing protein n=1 Tax=Camelliibacillus cellulosilyticus TaxID=2174486 RepID=A0ABV9GGP8_9BACL